MQLRDGVNKVQSNIFESGAFTIKTSAKAFKILSDNLYSDKITAVIRELSCNAYDAHVSAEKKNVPFLVHMPTGQEPFFSVKDFGTGMSKSFAMSLYTSYFMSDKTDRNDLIGALGLGSKSPFAYTDTFTIEVNYEKIKTIYTCFIDKTGTPNITVMNESETDEPNGVEVKMAVNDNHFSEFRQKAANVYKFFSVKPAFTGLALQVPEFEVIYQNENWKLIKGSMYDKKCYAVQGNIAYPIDRYKLGNLSDNQSFIIDNSFHINFNIGDLDIAASREALSYDELTIKTIKAKLDKVFEEFAALMTEKIADLPTLWEATCTAHELTDGLTHGSRLVISYKGKDIESHSFRITTSDIKTSVMEYDEVRNTIARKILTKNTTFSIPALKNVSFIINDIKRSGISRVRLLVKNKKAPVYVLDQRDSKLKGLLGNPLIQFASELPEPPKAEKEASARAAVKPCILFDGRIFYRATAMQFTEVKTSGNVFYAIIKRADVLHKDVIQDFSKFRQMVSNAQALDIITKKDMIVGVPSWATRNKAFKALKAIDIFDFLPKALKEAVEVNKKQIEDARLIQARYLQLSEDEDFYKNVLCNKKIIDKIINPASMFFTFKNEYEQAFEAHKGIILNTKLSALMNETNNHQVKLPQVKLASEAYPMIKFINSWKMNEHVQDVADYINAMDRVVQ